MTHYASFVMPSRKWKKAHPTFLLDFFFPKEVKCNLLLGLRCKGLILSSNGYSFHSQMVEYKEPLYWNEKEERLNCSDYLYMLESVKEKNKASSHSLPNTSPLNELQNRAHKFSLMTTHSKAHKLRYIMRYSIQKLLCETWWNQGKNRKRNV